MNSIVLTNEKNKLPWLPIAVTIILISLIYFYQWEEASAPQPNQSALTMQQQSILEQNDVINTNWLRTLNPLVEHVEGRIVWSNILQEGVMEFFDLPKIKDNQSYQLWIYDLADEDSKPIFSKEFSEVNSNLMLVPFSSQTKIDAPFKFELLLKTEGEENSQPLFLAQP